MLHHIILTQLCTFTSPVTQFGADNEPYMVLQVNRNPMDFQQLTSFLYEFIYPTPASLRSNFPSDSILSLIFPTSTTAAVKVFPPVIPACFSSQNFPARAFMISILPLIRLMLSRTILIPTWSTVPPAFSSLNVPAKKNGPFIM